MKKVMVIGLFFIFLMTSVLGHDVEDETEFVETDNEYLPLSIALVLFTFSLIPFVVILSNKKKITKDHIIFWGITFIITSITLLIVADTVYITLTSETKGPVHWHADFQIWDCGERVDIIDPKGLANRVGTSLLHEHGEDRVHIEGIVKNLDNVDLHSFFNVIGGKLGRDFFSVLTNEGVLEKKDGEKCNGKEGEVQIFTYFVTNSFARQKSGFLVEQIKVNENYVPSPYQDVPPGDCIIVEFDEPKEKTDKICETFELKLKSGEMVMLDGN